MFGADTLSDSVGEEAMTSNNGGKFTEVSYALKQGNPPVNVQIWVFEGTFKFTSPNDLEMNYTLSIYDASTDADGDAFPDPGAKTVIPSITGTGFAKRVLP